MTPPGTGFAQMHRLRDDAALHHLLAEAELPVELERAGVLALA